MAQVLPFRAGYMTKRICFKKIALWLMFVSGIILASGACWIVSKFGKVTAEQLLFHFYMPLEADLKMNVSFARGTLVPAVLSCLFFVFLLKFRFKSAFGQKTGLFFNRHFSTVCFFCFLGGVLFFVWKLNFVSLLSYYSGNVRYSSFYEENYVNPEKVSVVFPEKKKNLVLIFLESMETSYINGFDKNLLPYLSKAASENLNFSDTEEIGGAFPVEGTQWTIAGLVAQTCGLPLRMPIRANKYEQYAVFLPKAKCLPEFLKENGYILSFMQGSNISFAGMDVFLREHGPVPVKDFSYFKENGYVQEDYKVYWGIEDKKLYRFAKKELLDLSRKGHPFAFIMMTIDSHKGDGYFEKTVCPRLFDKEYENVMSCADMQAAGFLNWLSEQPFYKDTVVVIVGDHLGMNPFLEKVKNRRQMNIFINSEKTSREKNRKFTSFDLYPTILEGMGVQIEGGRLALGTSLFSGKKTFLEKGMDLEEANREIMKRSKIYDELFYGRKID